MNQKTIKSALISVFDKTGLDRIVPLLKQHQIIIYSTGGTFDFLKAHGLNPIAVEDITSYPSILDGRVKTLHPAVFGGILAIRNDDHLGQLEQYQIPTIDLVVVDLYPFEKTVASGAKHEDIIEKIDIGGISLIRAASKNYDDVVIVPAQAYYTHLLAILEAGHSSHAQRKYLAQKGFEVSSRYDTAIHQYFVGDDNESFAIYQGPRKQLRYGENPHQQAAFYGDLAANFDILCGKELSYNNLVDVDAAIQLVKEFDANTPSFVIIKHTNACGVASANTVLSAWTKALAGDPVSAFGGILATNATIDKQTAQEIDKIFYEVLIAPDFDEEALAILEQNKKRIILKLKAYPMVTTQVKSLLNGLIVQDADNVNIAPAALTTVTVKPVADDQLQDLIFANICAKHLKSNTITLVRNRQLLGMGCGQTSRVDALKQAIAKAQSFGFDLNGAVMASDAFFPFPDCVEIAHEVGINAVIQPGGSIKDKLSIDYCDAHDMAMVFTGIRHFKH